MPNLLSDKISSFKNLILQKFNVDISLVLIICLIAQYSFLLKFLGLAVLLFLNFNSIKSIRLKSIPLFYTLIPTIELIKFFTLDPNFSKGHIIQMIIGIIYWLASLVVCWTIFKRVRENEPDTIYNSLKFFVLLNFSISIFQYIKICLAEGVINPYNTGHHHPFGVSSGDMITGLLQGVHLTNVFVNLLLILFFIDKRNLTFSCLSLIPFLLCGSNYGTMLLFLCLGIYFLLSNKKIYAFKSSFFIFSIIIAFYWFVTPYNAYHTLSKLESIITKKPVVDEEYQKEMDQKIISAYQVNQGKLNNDERETIERMKKREGLKLYDFNREPGKKTSYTQTFHLLKSESKYLLFGAGLGKFSSNIAFNFSGVVDNSSMNRLFPEYQSPLFAQNHRTIYEYLKTTHVVFHSESNKPFSVYNQLLGEYGLIGLLLFIFAYLLYFLKRVDKRSHAIPIIVALLFAINLNYFIEGLNLFLFFELIMFMNIKEKELIHERG